MGVICWVGHEARGFRYLGIRVLNTGRHHHACPSHVHISRYISLNFVMKTNQKPLTSQTSPSCTEYMQDDEDDIEVAGNQDLLPQACQSEASKRDMVTPSLIILGFGADTHGTNKGPIHLDPLLQSQGELPENARGNQVSVWEKCIKGLVFSGRASCFEDLRYAS